MQVRRQLLFAIGLIALFPALAGTTGGISGMVKAEDGKPIAGAELTASNKSIGLKKTAASDRKGSYGFLTLVPGTYEIHVEAKGFVPQDRPGLSVHVNTAMKIDFTLVPEKAQ